MSNAEHRMRRQAKRNVCVCICVGNRVGSPNFSSSRSACPTKIAFAQASANHTGFSVSFLNRRLSQLQNQRILTPKATGPPEGVVAAVSAAKVTKFFIAADRSAATEEFNYMELTGGCLCGGTRYELKGAPFSLVIVIASIAGEVPVRPLSRGDQCIAQICADSRRAAQDSTCGSDSIVRGVLRHAFVFRGDQRFRDVDVTIASLDDPAPFAPQKAIWLEDKLPWVKLDESLPHFKKGRRPQMDTNKHEFCSSISVH